MGFVATVNAPGNLPDGNGRQALATASEAWWWLYHARCAAELDAPCDLCRDTLTHGVFGDCDDDSDTGRELAAKAKGGVGAGVVYGPTPGHDDDHGMRMEYRVSLAAD